MRGRFQRKGLNAPDLGLPRKNIAFSRGNGRIKAVTVPGYGGMRGALETCFPYRELPPIIPQMRPPEQPQPKTSKSYFAFFENKSKDVSRFLAWTLVVGLTINLLLVALIGFGAIPRSGPKVRPNTTPAPDPERYTDPMKSSAAQETTPPVLSTGR